MMPRNTPSNRDAPDCRRLATGHSTVRLRARQHWPKVPAEPVHGRHCKRSAVPEPPQQRTETNQAVEIYSNQTRRRGQIPIAINGTG